MSECDAIIATGATPDPLDALSIAVTLDGFLAVTRITQIFRNDETKAIEAVFTFPAPYGAVLVGVEAELAGQTLSSVAMGKRQAENRYEDAVSSGDAAILIEEASPGLYCVNLGNLAPGESATLSFTFGQLLEWRNDRLSIRIPTTIAPRYGVPKMEPHATPGAALDLVRKADLTVRVRNQAEGWKASSPTHEITASAEGEDSVIVVDGGRIVMDRDVVIDLCGSFHQTALSAQDGDGSVIVASFQPRPERRESTGRRVLKILIDRSGSMAGDSITQARQAVIAIMQSLAPGDLFSVTGFGSSVEFMTKGIIVATPDNVALAIEQAKRMEADLGGTEMKTALVRTFAQRFSQQETESADVLLITDGESWDDSGVSAAARASKHRIFAIGVGTAAAEHLLRRLGEETGGACEIVTPRDGMAERVIRQFDRMDARRLSGRITWPAGAVAIWPDEIKTAFAGDTIHAASWWAQEPAGTVAFTVMDGDDVVEIQSVALGQQASPDEERILAQIAAALRINAMDDPAAATELAVRYGLLTAHTHLVMVAERAEKTDGQPFLRKVDNMLAAGWMGMGVGAGRAANPPLACFRSMDMLFENALPAFLRREAPAPRRSSGVDPISRMLKSVNLGDVDFAWLGQLGAPSELCDQLKAFLAPGVGEGEIVLALLHALISEPAGKGLPKPQARMVRRAWKNVSDRQPELFADLQKAVLAVLSCHDWWRTMIEE